MWENDVVNLTFIKLLISGFSIHMDLVKVELINLVLLVKLIGAYTKYKLDPPVNLPHKITLNICKPTFA